MFKTLTDNIGSTQSIIAVKQCDFVSYAFENRINRQFKLMFAEAWLYFRSGNNIDICHIYATLR